MARAQNNSDDNTMSRQEAGERGGEATLEKYGPEFYSEIGQKQGKDNNPGNFANRPKDEVREAGRHGGESRGDSDS
jgi:general stress protein YciG